MRQIARKGEHTGGLHTVYDSIAEAGQHGVATIKHCKDKSVQVGEWIYYPDGVVAMVLHTHKNGGNWVIYTALNVFRQTGSEKKITSKYQSRHQQGKEEIDLENIDIYKTQFAESWLIKGLTLEESVKKHLIRFLYHYRRKKTKDYTLRAFGYIVLSGSWFDKLLEQNRLIRDRYMSIIGAFDEAGVNEAYLAKTIKEMLDSDNVKAKIAALKEAMDVIREGERRRMPHKAINAEFSAVDEQKMLEKDSTQKVTKLVEDIANEVKSEGSRVLTPEGEVRQAYEETRVDGNETKRNTSVLVE